MEQLHYNLSFRWFVGVGIDDPVWVPTVFTKNCDRLMNTEMSHKVMAAILAHREVKPLLSDHHFSVGGALVKAWASMKSFRPNSEGSQGDDGPGDPPSFDTAANEQPNTTEPKSTSGARSARMRATPRRLIRMRGFTRKRLAPVQHCASSVTGS